MANVVASRSAAVNQSGAADEHVLFRKLAISRFARTLGTLLGNGVPILQALSMVIAH